jgi:hypothetical protein
MNFNNPEVKVLREEKVDEYILTIAAMPMGHLCGYLTLPHNHPWSHRGYDEIEADVHGGLTYADPEGDGRYTVGFDCGHSGDSPDLQYMSLECQKALGWYFTGIGHVWNEFEVMEELRDLYRQAVSAQEATVSITQLAANRPVQAVLGSNLTGQDAESNGRVFASEEEALSLVAQFNELAFRLGFANRIGIHAFITEELI